VVIKQINIILLILSLIKKKSISYFIMAYNMIQQNFSKNVKLEIIMVLGPNAKILGPRIIQISY
jgi:hypothetical protein